MIELFDKFFFHKILFNRKLKSEIKLIRLEVTKLLDDFSFKIIIKRLEQ
jgi:hypothetical protein